tara:strand:+ start:367122 stop:368336 length:1215 start_codon:yes stop_codon:yes gene_type:complete
MWISVLGATFATADDWPRFRGDNGSGISDSSDIPSEWTESNYRWVADLPGRGNSSPVVWSEHVYVTAAKDAAGQRYLICLDKSTGEELWRAEDGFAKHKTHKNNSFASSTPAVDDDHVYQLWHSTEATSLIAYSHGGDEVWRYELGGYKHGQGGATSPIVAGNLVVVAHDHKDDSYLLAVDHRSGQPVWKIPREGKRACYSTPCVRKTDRGSDEIVFVHCYEGVIGVDAASGKQRWHIDPFGRESQRALSSPIVAGDLVFAGSGAAGGERHLVAIRVEDQGGTATASEAYHLTRQSPHVPSPLVIGDRLYQWNDGGIATCCELSTGEVIWQKRVGGNFFASPIAIGDRIFNIDTTGEVVVIAAADDFKVLARNPMGESSRASLATSEDVLFIRTDTKLFAVAGK